MDNVLKCNKFPKAKNTLSSIFIWGEYIFAFFGTAILLMGLINVATGLSEDFQNNDSPLPKSCEESKYNVSSEKTEREELKTEDRSKRDVAQFAEECQEVKEVCLHHYSAILNQSDFRMNTEVDCKTDKSLCSEQARYKLLANDLYVWQEDKIHFLEFCFECEKMERNKVERKLNGKVLKSLNSLPLPVTKDYI